jgi:hypothetical protein
MRFCGVLTTGVLVMAITARAQEAPVRAVGLTPRTTPGDYQFRTQAGSVTIAAEFMGHGVPTEEGGPYSTENYVVVEAALFGAPGAKIQLSYKDFSLRFNGKKQAEPSQPYVTVFPNLKDPEWEPPESEKNQASTSISGAGGSQSDRTKTVPKMPMGLRHTMEQRVLKASLSEGDRMLPQAGLLFFEWHGDVKGIRSMELVYSGPAGKAALELKKP